MKAIKIESASTIVSIFIFFIPFAVLGLFVNTVFYFNKEATFAKSQRFLQVINTQNIFLDNIDFNDMPVKEVHFKLMEKGFAKEDSFLTDNTRFYYSEDGFTSRIIKKDTETGEYTITPEIEEPSYFDLDRIL